MQHTVCQRIPRRALEYSTDCVTNGRHPVRSKLASSSSESEGATFLDGSHTCAEHVETTGIGDSATANKGQPR